MTIKPSQGEVWSINLDPTVGHEQADVRPCIVVSDDRLNHGPAGLLVIVPLTGSYKNVPWHIEIKAPEGGLKKDSYAITDQIRSVSIERFLGTSCWGNVTPETLQAVHGGIQFLLGL